MRKADKPVVENFIVSKPSDGHAHTRLEVPFGPRLRSVVLVEIFEEGVWCTGQLELLGRSFEIFPDIENPVSILELYLF